MTNDAQNNYYDILHVSTDADDYVILTAWLNISKSELSAEQKDAAEAAYRILSNKESRRKYDRSLGIPEPTIPVSVLHETIAKHKEEIKKTQESYTLPLIWIIAAAPVLYRKLYPVTESQTLLQSILNYFLLTAGSVFTIGMLIGGVYLILVAACQVKYESRKIITIGLFLTSFFIFIFFKL